jgi:hypothetical protein
MMMTSDAKSKLSKTIRALRQRLLTELNEAVDREYKFTLKNPKLDTKTKVKRQRLEDWLAEQVRTQFGKVKRTKEDFRHDAEKQAAYTLLNRLVILRIMEAVGLRKPKVVTGGWNSQGYKDFRELAQALVHSDDGEGYPLLLQLIFDDLAIDLPGLYGSAGMADLIPVPSPTIRAVVEALDDEELESCWNDDMTLGWVYQYWNDPEREALDAKLNDGGKIEPHEIASKTQMFTERYMVDWLLQNSLGPMWLAMCQKHGWTPDIIRDGTLDRLEQRRVEWRTKREAGEVALTDLIPLENDAERRWAYYVPQPIPDDAVKHSPTSVYKLKILDPAVGSGHFLVVAFDLLFALYKEEAKHRGQQDGEQWTDQAIVERIFEYNLHGIDLDPRAVQIAAAALWLKAQQTCPTAELKQLNLVASNLGISRLGDNDPSLVELRRVIEKETGIPGKLTMQIVEALKGADHLGSLLKIDQAIEGAIASYEEQTGWKNKVVQITLFPDGTKETKSRPISREWVATGVLSALENFLSRHTSSEELGLRLAGEQLAAGVRFVRLVKEGAYDLVVANPPYQGTSKMTDVKYISKKENYKLGKADLFAAFLLRGLQLVHEHGVSAMLTMRNWMFIKQYSELRQHLLKTYDLRALGDFAVGAFDEVPNDVLSVVVSVFIQQAPCATNSIAQQPTPPNDTSYDRQRTKRKRAATLCHVGRHMFDPSALKVVPEWPLVYWWDENILTLASNLDCIKDRCRIRQGLATGNDSRYLRRPWEPATSDISAVLTNDNTTIPIAHSRLWVPYIKGAAGKSWYEPLDYAIPWSRNGLNKRLNHEYYGTKGGNGTPSMDDYFRGGTVFASIGASFSARQHRFRSIFGSKGCTAFSESEHQVCAVLNTNRAKRYVQDLNPTIDFTINDVLRILLFEVASVEEVFDRIESDFSAHESHREPSVEFKQPGPSPWRHAQEWAQLAVDRPEGVPLPEYVEQLDLEPPTDHLSFAFGVALGRFATNGEGILNPTKDDLSKSLPHGILFLDGALGDDDPGDSLDHFAAQIIHDKWSEYGSLIDKKRSLRDWLREKFFPDVHKGRYENRPIHWPLSSAKKTFVAWVTIHRWTDHTLRVLLGDHFEPALKRLDGEITDLTAARNSADNKQARSAEDRYADVKAWRDELAEFIRQVEECAERGSFPPDPKKPEREVDARYIPDLDDGVMINSAPLWPLLDPQWKDPKKWWKELVAAKGKKDYDWSHLAMRYWPTRVDAKCQQDPSLGVAHGCFWKYHPARAWAWELRLQDEICPDFRIEEASYRGDGGGDEHRANYLRDNPTEALAAIEKEALRRIRKQKKPQPELTILEPGLWSAVPDESWDLELRLTDKQQVEFRLLAPDEPESRAQFEKSHPDQVKFRNGLLRKLSPPDLFANQEEVKEIPEIDDAEEVDV